MAETRLTEHLEWDERNQSVVIRHADMAVGHALRELTQALLAERERVAKLRAGLKHYADPLTWCEMRTGHYLPRQEGQTEDRLETFDAYNGEGRGYERAQQVIREDGNDG